MSSLETLEDIVMEKPTNATRHVILVSLQLPLLYLHNEISIYDNELAEREILPFLVGEVFPELADNVASQGDMVTRLTMLGMPQETAGELLQRGLMFVVDAITEHLPNLPASADTPIESLIRKRRLKIVGFAMRGSESVQLTIETSTL